MKNPGAGALIAQTTVEALVIAILPRTARLDIQGLDTKSGKPCSYRLGCKLGAVIGTDMRAMLRLGFSSTGKGSAPKRPSTISERSPCIRIGILLNCGWLFLYRAKAQFYFCRIVSLAIVRRININQIHISSY